MPAIVIKDLVIELGENKILPDDLCIEGSGKILYVGRTGSGKTVLLKTISGIIGDIYEARIHGLLRRQGTIHYVPQEPWPLSLGITGYEEILLTAHLHNKGNTNKLLEKIFSENIFLKNRIKNMSYGEKRLLEILKTLITEPDILLIDEPYESLDEINRKRINEIINEIQDSRQSIIIATSKKPLTGWRILSVKKKSFTKIVTEASIDPMITGRGRVVVKEGSYVMRGKKRIEYPNIDLRPGESIAITGPNGVGKTSLLLGIAGAIRIRGEYTIAGNIGYVPDDVSMIFSWFKAIDLIRDLCGENGICFDESIRVLEELGIGLQNKFFYEFSDGEKRLLLMIPQIISGKNILLIDGGLEYIDHDRLYVINKMLEEYLESGGIIITTLPHGDELDVLEGLVLTTP